ncbi:hypothetical protein [Rhodococcus sp. NPDC060176]|uniref:hypothetical protein n=1 Tax=Rhodococcus sp. NPDC060176 TaxID=3347062 RepID=UPI00364E821F
MDHTQDTPTQPAAGGAHSAETLNGAEDFASMGEFTPSTDPDPAGDDFAAAMAAYDSAEEAPYSDDDDVVFAFEPQVLFDTDTGDTRLSVLLPIDDDTVQQIHVPLDAPTMAALVDGFAEARGVQRRQTVAGGADSDSIDPLENDAAPRRSGIGSLRESVAGRKMVDPAGLGRLKEDDFPELILGIPRQRFFLVVIGVVMFMSFLLALLT